MKLSITVASLLFSLNTWAAPIIYHSDTFESGDTSSWEITNPDYFGSPDEVGPIAGHTTSSTMRFDSREQVRYVVDAEHGDFTISFDLTSTGGPFRVFFDSPIAHQMEFFGDGTFRLGMSNGYYDGYNTYTHDFGNYSLLSPMQFDINLNTFAKTIEVSLNGESLFTGEAITDGLRAVRFSGASNSGYPSYIDNVMISSVPVPAAVWLFGSALAGLGWFRRRQAA